jgi:hypothetical protein
MWARSAVTALRAGQPSGLVGVDFDGQQPLQCRGQRQLFGCLIEYGRQRFGGGVQFPRGQMPVEALMAAGGRGGGWQVWPGRCRWWSFHRSQADRSIIVEVVIDPRSAIGVERNGSRIRAAQRCPTGPYRHLRPPVHRRDSPAVYGFDVRGDGRLEVDLLVPGPIRDDCSMLSKKQNQGHRSVVTALAKSGPLVEW